MRRPVLCAGRAAGWVLLGSLLSAAPVGAQVAAPAAGDADPVALRLAGDGFSHAHALVARPHPPDPPIHLHVLLRPDHAAQADRILDAATEALTQYGEWFVPYPSDRLTIVDLPWSARGGVPLPAGVIAIRARLWQLPRTLTIEAEIARAISRQWWGGLVQMASPREAAIADGIAAYLQSRTVERIFDRRHQAMAYSLFEVRAFGGFVPWAIRALRLDRATTGLDRPAFRRHPNVGLDQADPSLREARAAKVAAALGTLERYLGWPVVQRGLRAAARRFAGQAMPADQFYATLSDAAGRDLSWFFNEALGGQGVFDYAIDSLSTAPDTAGTCGSGACFLTTVVVVRRGDAVFSGSSQPALGDFESGRGITVRVRFADGQQALESWDGRARAKTIEYRSPAAAVSAHVDPDQVLLLDLNTLNNYRSVGPVPNTPALAWGLRWTIWLQDFMLTCAAFF